MTRRFITVIFLIAISVTFISCATKGAGPSGGESAPKGKVVINWSTESEEDNYGYNIYRSKSEEGPFRKINETIIQGAGTTSDPHEYVFVDQPLEIGESYYYYIESVSFAGVKERFTPVSKVVVKKVMDESIEPQE